VKEIINAVRDYEPLYRNISFECEETVETLRPPDVKVAPSMILNEKSKSHLVLQKELTFYEQTRQGASGNGPFDFGFKQAYDGEKILEYSHSDHQGKKGDTGNIITGLRPHLPAPLTPQQLGCRLMDYVLSEYLDGSHLNKLNKMNTIQETTFEGEESIDGLRCVKIQILLKGTTPDGKRQVDKQVLWLAPERNYLPVKTEVFVGSFVERPFVTNQASDFREIQPGTFVPFHGEKINYNQTKDGRTLPGSKTVTTVKAVDLNPQFPLTFFQDVSFPPGTLVYVQKGDNIVLSYLQPAPEVAAPGFFGRWLAALVGLAGLFACAAVAVFALRRRRAGRSATC
jgi:hypothetical protein